MTDRPSLSFGADSTSVIQYSNANWTQVESGTGSTYLTRDPNATATFSFNGTLITVAGTVSSDSPVQNFQNSPLSYVLDGQDDLTFLYNSSSPIPIIYSSPELPLGLHTLAIRLITENTTLSISGGNITTVGDGVDSASTSASVSHHRTIIAIVAGTLGGSILIAVIALGVFLFNRRSQRQYSSTPYALGPLQASLPSTKEAFTSPKYSNHGIVFTQSTDEVNVILPRVHVKAPRDPYETSRPKPAARKQRTSP